MKRLRRIIFNAISALLLLLCIATAGLWVRSLKVEDVWYYHRPGALGMVFLISSSVEAHRNCWRARFTPAMPSPLLPWHSAHCAP